jgi:hypothetical protein
VQWLVWLAWLIKLAGGLNSLHNYILIVEYQYEQGAQQEAEVNIFNPFLTYVAWSYSHVSSIHPWIPAYS